MDTTGDTTLVAKKNLCIILTQPAPATPPPSPLSLSLSLYQLVPDVQCSFSRSSTSPLVLLLCNFDIGFESLKLIYEHFKNKLDLTFIEQNVHLAK